MPRRRPYCPETLAILPHDHITINSRILSMVRILSAMEMQKMIHLAPYTAYNANKHHFQCTVTKR